MGEMSNTVFLLSGVDFDIHPDAVPKRNSSIPTSQFPEHCSLSAVVFVPRPYVYSILVMCVFVCGGGGGGNDPRTHPGPSKGRGHRHSRCPKSISGGDISMHWKPFQVVLSPKVASQKVHSDDVIRFMAGLSCAE